MQANPLVYEYCVVVTAVPESVLREILEDPGFQDALQILADQGEEAVLEEGVMLAEAGSSRIYEEVRFPIRNRETRGLGECTNLVFMRTPEGKAFVSFEGENPLASAPSSIEARGGWSDWMNVSPTEWSCQKRWGCWTKDRGWWYKQYQTKGSQIRYRWHFGNCAYC
jgi:hypothetical protein